MPHGIAFWLDSHGVVAKPGASVFLLLWAGVKANTNWATRNQSSLELGGGDHESTNAQNNEISTDIWLDDGTYKYAQVHFKDSNRGIYSVQLDAVEQGTIDGYSAGTVLNTYSEITGISITKGLKVFKLKMATKNGSSSGYIGGVNSCAWIRTA